MTTFDDRENAFENKYAYDEEMKFRAQARCNKLLGLWAAELLGKTGDDADAYAKEVVLSDFEEAGHEDVVRKVAADLGDLAQKLPHQLILMVLAHSRGRHWIRTANLSRLSIGLRRFRHWAWCRSQ